MRCAVSVIQEDIIMCQIQIEKKENYILVTLQGEVTLGCTAEVKEKVKEYAELNKQYHLIADMTGVTFIDSSGLGVMVAWFKMPGYYCGI